MSGGNGIRVMLWDADGVLQHNEEDWRIRLDAVGGEGFGDAVFDAEGPALRGETRLRDAIRATVDAWPSPTPSVDAILALWEQTVVDHDAMAVVDEVRARGVLSCLATNQQDHRVAWMTEQLDYPAHFDRTYWSSRMGLVKPDEEFFRHILADLGVAAEEVGFVDDSAANVDAARRVGIRAVRHDPTSGAQVLRREVGELLGDGVRSTATAPSRAARRRSSTRGRGGGTLNLRGRADVSCAGGVMSPSPTAVMQQLHDEHAAALWGYCLRLTSHDHARAEDVMQETLLRAWRRWDRLEESHGSVRSWLYTVARNIVIDEWRSRRSRSEVTVAEVPEVGDPDEVDRMLQSWVVADALGALSVEHRAVVVECYYRGASVAQAAARLGIPEGTVKSRTHYALRALRLALNERGILG